MSGFKIDRLYAFVTVDRNDGDEGVIGFRQPDGQWFPMIGADIDRVESLKPLADQLAEKEGIKYEIKYFRLETEDG